MIIERRSSAGSAAARFVRGASVVAVGDPLTMV
jgi:hypothetical protein